MNTDHKERAHPMPIQHTTATPTQNWKDASLMALLENEKSIVLVILQTTEAWEQLLPIKRFVINWQSVPRFISKLIIGI